jgi:hypothetical protein
MSEYISVPYQRHSDTSKEAAKSMVGHVSRLALEVEKFIASKGQFGATEWEASVGLNMLHQTSSARIRELCLKNRIRKNGEKRPTATGRNAAVWVISYDGQGSLF